MEKCAFQVNIPKKYDSAGIRCALTTAYGQSPVLCNQEICPVWIIMKGLKEKE